MVTVKDIAQEVGLSVSTVSIVLRGKSDEMKISVATQQKIWNTAKQMGYRPNLSARRLRSSESDALQIAIYWTVDYRSSYMVRFLAGLEARAEEMGISAEFVIKPYKSLRKSFSASAMYHGAIICNASEDDMKFLEELPEIFPVIVYNRFLDRYSTVEIDYDDMARQAVAVFKEKNVKKSMLVLPDIVLPTSNQLESSFLKYAEEEDINVEIMTEADSIEGGARVSDEIACKIDEIQAVFSSSSNFSYSILNNLELKKICIPDDVLLLGVGSGEQSMEEYAIKPISTLQIMREQMAASCLDILYREISEKKSEQVHTKFAPVYIRRVTC